MILRALLIFICLVYTVPASADDNVKPPESAPVNSPNLTPLVISAVDQPAIRRIEDYLGSIKSIKADFSQISPDGGISSGKFFLQRPGKLRMTYDPPVPVLVIASNGNLVYYDTELKQVTNVSLDSTLVGFLARDRIKFDNSVSIVHFERGQKSVRIGIIQSNKPKDGSMTLEFTDKPLLLRNIIITDSAGESTIVSLADARFGDKLDPGLFVFKDPNLSGSKHIQK
jgi:outer membrane lipoprotein-sorting protein